MSTRSNQDIVVSALISRFSLMKTTRLVPAATDRGSLVPLTRLLFEDRVFSGTFDRYSESLRADFQLVVVNFADGQACRTR